MSIYLAPIYRSEPYIEKTKAQDANGRLVTLPALVDRIAALESELAASRAQCERLEQSLADAKSEASALDAKVATLRAALGRMVDAVDLSIRHKWLFQDSSLALSTARAALAATEEQEGGAL